jgi:hypothetical protein
MKTKTKMKIFKGYYVTDQGEFYSLKTGLKKYTWHNQGRCNAYERIQFIVDGKPKNYYVHRIVASLYWKGWSEELEANHKNGNTLDNRAANIDGMTRSQNATHMIKMKMRGTNCIFKQGEQKIYLGATK